MKNRQFEDIAVLCKKLKEIWARSQFPSVQAQKLHNIRGVQKLAKMSDLKANPSVTGHFMHDIRAVKKLEEIGN